MIMQNEIVDIFFKVLDMYRSHMYTQEAIAKEMNIPIEAVAFCTQKAGYANTKAKKGERGVYYEDEPIFAEFAGLLKK